MYDLGGLVQDGSPVINQLTVHLAFLVEDIN
jgi:hypothetical protein